MVQEFEKIRDVFEDIQTKITLKQAGVHGPSYQFGNAESACKMWDSKEGAKEVNYKRVSHFTLNGRVLMEP